MSVELRACYPPNLNTREFRSQGLFALGSCGGWEGPGRWSCPLDLGKGDSSWGPFGKALPSFPALLPALAGRLDPVAMTTGRGGGGGRRCCGEMEASGGGVVALKWGWG